MAADSLADLKSRMRPAEVVETAAPATKPVDPIRESTRSQISDFEKAVEEQEAARAVDLGPIPEEALANMQPVDDMVYRHTAIDNPEVRAAVEARCAPMDFADLVITNRVLQLTPILKDKLEPLYQSLVSTEQFWLESNMHRFGETTFGMQTWLGYGRLVFSLKGLNGHTYAPCFDKSNEVDEKAFEAKFKQVLALPEQFVTLMLLNLGWFSARVESLYKDDFDLLKNG